MQPDFYELLSLASRHPSGAALCTVTFSQGSTPRKAGAKMIVYGDGKTEGTIGGGSIELMVTEEAKKQIRSGAPLQLKYDLEKDAHMECGGIMEVFIEPLTQSTPLFIFGAGHVGKAVAKFAQILGFSVTLIDERKGISASFNHDGMQFIEKIYFEAIEEIKWDERSYAVIVTPKHSFDEAILKVMIRKPHTYLGMIGSKNKVATIKQNLLNEKLFTSEELNAVDTPIGIPFNAQTPEEIAVSIVAKMIDVRNNLKL
ncbi:MAG: XdhC family protein [Bacteroidota bacterium]